MTRKLFNLAYDRTVEALEEQPHNFNLRACLADIYRDLFDFHQARQIYEELLGEEPDNTRVMSNLSATMMGTGDREAAVEIQRKLIDSRESKEKLRASLALVDIFERTNDTQGAREVLAGIEDDDEDVVALRAYAEGRLLLQDKRYDEAVSSILRFIAFREANAGSGSHLPAVQEAHFQLAKAYDKMGEYGLAWDSATRGHEPYQGWDPSKMLAELEETRTYQTRSSIASLAHADEDFEWEPLLVVGMPRSGTTLLEQIMSMHPQISNGGEMSISMRMVCEVPRLTGTLLRWPKFLVDLRVDDVNQLGRLYMDALRPFAGTTRIVSNKALNLQAHLGLVSMAVPGSRAIMLHRHPLDNAVSCYMTPIVTIGHRYTSDLSTFGKVWIARRKLQEHWLEQLDIPMMELQYESLVQNQESETRRLLEFLDVPWEPGCLDFHKSRNMARTISSDQVNRKMYSTSDGRWRNYEKYLGPVIDEVGEYL